MLTVDRVHAETSSQLLVHEEIVEPIIEDEEQIEIVPGAVYNDEEATPDAEIIVPDDEQEEVTPEAEYNITEEESTTPALDEVEISPYSMVTVSNLADLRTEITNANTGSVTEIVIAAPGFEISGTAISISSSNLTIRGEEAGVTLNVSRADAFALTSSGDVRFENLVFDGGNVNGRTSINVNSGTAIINNVTIRNFTNSGIRVADAGGYLTVEDGSVIHHNSSPVGGGGIFAQVPGSASARVTVTMTGGQIRNNTATTTGGGIHLNNGVFNMDVGSLIYNNTSGTAGGGVHIGGEGSGQLIGTFNMSGGLIEDNTATSNGGGVNLAAGRVFNMFGGVIFDNMALGLTGGTGAGTGGGVQTAGPFTMSNDALIDDNTATTAGGGINTTATFTMSDDAQITNNVATTAGGGVQSTAPFTMLDRTLIYNNEAGSSGGGVQTSNTFNMRNNARIENNEAGASGGGVNTTAAATITMFDNTVIYNNEAGSNGGGVQTSGVFTMRDNANIENNKAMENGGGVAATTSFTMLNNSSIYNNEASLSGGGVQATGTFTMTDNALIEYNSSIVAGGGINTSGRATMQSGAITRNRAGTNGGGVNITGAGIFDIESGEITHNTATGDPPNSGFGGGIAVTGIFNMGDAVISSNIAYNGGGGVGVLPNVAGTHGGRFYMTDGLITGNEARGQGGGGVNLGGTSGSATEFIMSNGSIANNNATIAVGGGVRSVNSIFNLQDEAEISNNSAFTTGGGIHAGGDNPGTTFTMTGNVSINNNDAFHGGGVSLAGIATLTMQSGSEIRDNDVARYGGGVYVSENSIITMEDGSEILRNVAISGGGVGVFNSSIFNMNGGLVGGNTANTGGGVRLFNAGRINMTDGVISENVATNSGGGGISLPGTLGNTSTITMTGGEISHNTATFGGGIGFTAITSWDILNTALNRITIENSQTTVAHNTATMGAINGLSLRASNPQINPTHYVLHGFIGNHYALNHHDIQADFLNRIVTFAAPNGTLTPTAPTITVPQGDTVGSDAIVPVATPNNHLHYEFSHWISNSTYHHVNGDPNTPFTEHDIRENLVIMEDTIFTAIFVRINRLVTFAAPNGTLTPPDVNILVPSGDPLGNETTIPTAIPDAPNYEFSHWISSDPAHPSELATDDLGDLIINQDTVFTAVFRPIIIPITGINNVFNKYSHIMLAVLALLFGRVIYQYWQKKQLYSIS